MTMLTVPDLQATFGLTARIPETRCVHDMLTFHVRVVDEDGARSVKKSSCSICRGLPYWPTGTAAELATALVEFEPELAADEPARDLIWLPSERRDTCTRCESPIAVGQPAANMPGPAASVRVVGSCCREEVE